MATMNPFDLLGDDDNDDPSYLIAVHQQKIAAKKPSVAAAAPVKAPAKLPSKPLPPTQAGEQFFYRFLYILFFVVGVRTLDNCFGFIVKISFFPL